MRIEDRSQEVLSELKSKIGIAFESIGYSAEGYASILCPVDTGRLRASITHIVDDYSMTVGTDVEYGVYVELGTSKRDGRPFIGPSIADHLDEYKNILHSVLQS